MKDFRTALLTSCISIYSGVTVALANSTPDMQPVWGMMAGDVQKWCNGCERKISDLINADAKEDCFKTTVLCTFLVDKDGHILKPFIWRSRGLARDDERALHIIQRAQPFQKPPINLGSRRLVAIFTSNRPVEINVDCKDYKQADSELIFERQRHSYQSCNQETSGHEFPRDTLILSPCWNEPPDALRPWFNGAKTKIEKAIATNTIKFDDELSVAFLLDENGGVEDPIFANSVTDRRKAQAEAIVNLLNKCVPFDKPPDELLHKQRLLLLFRHYPNFYLQMDTFAGYKMWKDRDMTFQEMKKMMKRDEHIEKIGPGSIIR